MASESTIATQIRTALAHHLKRDVSKIRPQDRLREDLELDSLAMIELLFKIEEHFDLEIPNEDLSRVTTVADVTAYVEEKMGAAAAAPAAPSAKASPPQGEAKPPASRADQEEGLRGAQGEAKPPASRADREEGLRGAQGPVPPRRPGDAAPAKPAPPARSPAKVTSINAATTRKAAHASPKAAAKKKGSRPA